MSWFAEYKSSLKMVEVEEFFDLFFYRPLAFILIKIIYRTSITPNQLTYIAIVLGLMAGWYYAQGLPNFYITGAFFFAGYNIVDCSDGMLARLKKNGTNAGRIVDGMADYIATVAVFIGIGIGFANHQINPTYWWTLLVVTGLSNAVQSTLVDYYRNRFLDVMLQRSNTFEEGLEAFRKEYDSIKDQKGKWDDKIILQSYFIYSAIQRKVTAKKKKEIPFKANPSAYYQKNKLAMRIWTFIGPTAQITTLMICSVINRFDIFIWLMLILFNFIAATMWLVQRNIDKSFKILVT